jgi:SDR family mycofactocin-dependent oxidoreductase
MGRLENKVAFISGVARGQGRSHAVRLAEEGCDIIGFDICENIDSNFYDLATKEDLEETATLVRKTGRNILTSVADVRDYDQVKTVFEQGIDTFGKVDIVLPNAGIMPILDRGEERQAWHDAVDVCLTGVWNTLDIVTPHMIANGTGGSITITSSTGGLKGYGLNHGPGQAGYVAAKHGVIGLMRLFAIKCAPHSIRVNTIHPTGVNTHMVTNPEFEKWTIENPDAMEGIHNAMPVELIEPVDISNAIVFLASDEGRYITGTTMPVDAGFLAQ